MGRIDGQRRQDWPNLRVVVILHPLQLLRRKFVQFEEANAVAGELRLKLFAPAAILVVDHFLHTLPDGSERLGRRHAVNPALTDLAFDLLFDAGYAHLEELVEIGMGDAEKLEPFEQRVGGIKRLVQDPLVEFQPTEFAVEKVCSRASRHTDCVAATILTVPRQREKLQSRHKVGMKFARLSLNRNNPKIASDPQLRYLFSSRDQPFNLIFNVMKKSSKRITEARKLWELSTKAAEAQSKARSARVEVRVAKLKFKSARKEFKEAKKAAKVAMKDAEAIQRVLKAVATAVSKAAVQAEVLRPIAASRNLRRTRVRRTTKQRFPTISPQRSNGQPEPLGGEGGAEELGTTPKIPGFASS